MYTKTLPVLLSLPPFLRLHTELLVHQEPCRRQEVSEVQKTKCMNSQDGVYVRVRRKSYTYSLH